MSAKTYRTTIFRDGPMCFVPVPFDPKPVFGKTRAPVRVTLNGFTYRSTIFVMRGQLGLPLRKSNREAAGLEGGETLDVTVELDTEERSVEPPADLAAALQAAPDLWNRWRGLSVTRRREDVEAVETAKRVETRQRRIAKVLSELASKA